MFSTTTNGFGGGGGEVESVDLGLTAMPMEHITLNPVDARQVKLWVLGRYRLPLMQASLASPPKLYLIIPPVINQLGPWGHHLQKSWTLKPSSTPNFSYKRASLLPPTSIPSPPAASQWTATTNGLDRASLLLKRPPKALHWTSRVYACVAGTRLTCRLCRRI
jgi:hypothetical protein